MKHAQPLHDETEGDLQHYLHERPDLLLKMLDIAEVCWRESERMAMPDAGERANARLRA